MIKDELIANFKYSAWTDPLRLDIYGLSHNAFLRVVFRK